VRLVQGEPAARKAAAIPRFRFRHFWQAVKLVDCPGDIVTERAYATLGVGVGPAEWFG